MNLTNHFLVAMPSMQDPNFKGSVVYVCEHNNEGAMGIVINLPIDISVGSMLDQIEVERELPVNDPASLEQPVFNGGPVSVDRDLSSTCTSKRTTLTPASILPISWRSPLPWTSCLCLAPVKPRRNSWSPRLRRLVGRPAGAGTGRKHLADHRGRPRCRI